MNTSSKGYWRHLSENIHEEDSIQRYALLIKFRILTQILCWGMRPSLEERGVSDMIQSCIWRGSISSRDSGLWSTPSLLLITGPLRPGVVIPVTVLFFGSAKNDLYSIRPCAKKKKTFNKQLHKKNEKVELMQFSNFSA